MPGPLIQAPKGPLLPGDPLKFAPIGLVRPMVWWVALHERGPFGIPDSFRRLTPRVSGLRPASEAFCSSFPSVEGWTAKPDGVVLLLVAPAKHRVVCGSVYGVLWRRNPSEWSSFRRDPAKRAVLTLGDSPARCAYAPAAPIAVDSLLHAIPKQGTLAGHHLPASSQFRRRATCTSAKTRIRHNAKFCVLTRSRQDQTSPPPPPEAHITRNSSHKHEFDIISLLGRRLRRGEQQ